MNNEPPPLCGICQDELEQIITLDGNKTGRVIAFYKETCSKECARTLHIKSELAWLSDRIKDLTHV